jgi:hypothetical protein
MEKIYRLLKMTLEGVGILLFLIILFVFINDIRGSSQSDGISTGAYPPPQVETELVPTTQSPAPTPQPTIPGIAQSKYYIGPDCLHDESKQLALLLPEGWYGDISSNLISITNYDPNSLQYDHGKPINIPIDHIKIEIYPLVLDPGQTLEQYITTLKAQASKQDNTRPALTFRENTPYKLGNYDGMGYAITDPSGWNSKTIIFRVDANKGIAVSLFPANSPAFLDALALLSTLDGSEQTTTTCPLTSAPP